MCPPPHIWNVLSRAAIVVVVVYGSVGQLVLLCLGLVLAFVSDLLALAVPSLHGCKPGKGLEKSAGGGRFRVKKAEKSEKESQKY